MVYKGIKEWIGPTLLNCVSDCMCSQFHILDFQKLFSLKFLTIHNNFSLSGHACRDVQVTQDLPV